MPEAAVTDYIEHGYDFATPLYLGEDINLRSDGLDAGIINFSAKDRDAFVTGQSLDGDWAGLIVRDIARRRDGNLYDFALSVEGVNGPKPARRLSGYPDVKHALSEWDRVEDKWITTNPDLFVEGQLGSYGGTTICTLAGNRLLRAGFYEVSGSFAGIIRPKDSTRQISVNGQTVSGDKIVVNLEGGWTTPRKGQAQLAKIVVRDRYLTYQPPPTYLIPGNATPPAAPAIRIIAVNGTDVTYHWPGGWHLAGLDSVQPFGRAGIYQTDWIYEYQWHITP